VVRESFRLSPVREQSVDLVILAKVAATTAPNDKLYKALDRRWLSLIAFCERSAANP
jgi:RNase P protein component